MANASPTLTQMFSLHPTDTMQSDAWDRFRERLHEEAKDIKWTAAMSDLLPKVAELFDIPVSRVFIASWKKAEALREEIEASRQAPEDTFSIWLSEHTMTSEFHPRIDGRVGGATIKRITFTVRLSLMLQGFELRIKSGKFTHINAGRFGGEGSILYADLQLVSKDFPSYDLLPAIPIDSSSEVAALAES
jgi:hypothetical protein